MVNQGINKELSKGLRRRTCVFEEGYCLAVNVIVDKIIAAYAEEEYRL